VYVLANRRQAKLVNTDKLVNSAFRHDTTGTVAPLKMGVVDHHEPNMASNGK